MVKLSQQEKKEMCLKMAGHMPRIRALLNTTQKEFGELCGISTPRISVIENEKFTMTWSQFAAILMVCMCNISTKEYVYANDILTDRLLQYLQRKDGNIPPTINIILDTEMIERYKV